MRKEYDNNTLLEVSHLSQYFKFGHHTLKAVNDVSFDIKKGEVLSDNNITVKRPGTGISPMRWYEVIGKTAIHNFKEDELIEV